MFVQSEARCPTRACPVPGRSHSLTVSTAKRSPWPGHQTRGSRELVFFRTIEREEAFPISVIVHLLGDLKLWRI